MKKIGSKDFDLLPIDEINEDDMLTPKEFQKRQSMQQFN